MSSSLVGVTDSYEPVCRASRGGGQMFEKEGDLMVEHFQLCVGGWVGVGE